MKWVRSLMRQTGFGCLINDVILVPVMATLRIRSYISVYKRSAKGVLPFTEEKCIMLISAKPRENLPSWQSNNFCQDAQKEQVKTFVICACKRGSTAQSAWKGYLCQASGVFVTTCLPSRLSRVRVPSPALFPQSSLSWRLICCFTGSKQ
jgi:hypothetical protein